MNKLLALLVLLMAVPVAPAAAKTSDQYPLLKKAHELQLTREPDRRASLGNGALRNAEHALRQANAPSDAECKGSMGAVRFAQLHAGVASARGAIGDYAGAVSGYRSALACRPRDAETLQLVGSMLFNARDFSGAREAVAASLALDPRDVSANRQMGNLDFVAERWADAIARFRYVAASDPNRAQAGYGQLMLWLAQLRAGIPNPELVKRTPSSGWPEPLLAYLRGESSESELLAPIEDGGGSESEGDDEYDYSGVTFGTDERLCEALYYVGQAYWARGQKDVARDYFAALINIKVVYFLEHGLALAELAKLRTGSATATSQAPANATN